MKVQIVVAASESSSRAGQVYMKPAALLPEFKGWKAEGDTLSKGTNSIKFSGEGYTFSCKKFPAKTFNWAHTLQGKEMRLLVGRWESYLRTGSAVGDVSSFSKQSKMR